MASDVRTPGYALTVRATLAAVLAICALAVTGGARADLGAPTITLGTLSLTDTTVTLTGSVEDDGAHAELHINGQPVDIAGTGDFSAVVDLDLDEALVLDLTGQDETVTIKIPFSVLESEGDGALDALKNAGITIHVPDGGFKMVDGNAPLVTGSVANDDSLAGLNIGGVDVLDALGPGGGFSIFPQGSTGGSGGSGVTVVATDTRGVTQTSTFSVTNVSSVIRTKAGASVSAAGARGIVIAAIRFDKRHLKTAKRVGVVVTVKDRRGLLIRGAALRLNGKPRSYLTNGSIRAGFTNRFGKARFTYRLRTNAFAKCGCTKLAITVRASTPTAAKTKKAMLRLPRLAPV